jgi:hypothetical protein
VQHSTPRNYGAALIPATPAPKLFERRYDQVFAWAIDALASHQSVSPPPARILREAVDDLVEMLAAALTARLGQ